MKRIRAHLTYANVVSTLCLFALLGGGAYAATHLKKHSVGTKQLKANAVTGAKIADGAITTSKIADRQVTGPNLADGAVTGIKVADESISTGDIEGTDVTGTITLSAGAVAAHSCITLGLGIAGAQPGDAALLSFVGGTAPPQGLTFQLLRVSAPGQGTIRSCNPTNAPSPAAADVGIRIVTFR